MLNCNNLTVRYVDLFLSLAWGINAAPQGSYKWGLRNSEWQESIRHHFKPFTLERPNGKLRPNHKVWSQCPSDRLVFVCHGEKHFAVSHLYGPDILTLLRGADVPAHRICRKPLPTFLCHPHHPPSHQCPL